MKDVAPDGHSIEQPIFLTDTFVIELRILEQRFLIILEVKDSEPDDGKCREYEVESLVLPLLIERLSRECVLDAKPELRHHEKHVFEEGEANQV